jgi:hypothetical protein
MGDTFAATTDFDPARANDALPVFSESHPRRMQAWREADELDGPRAHAVRPLARSRGRELVSACQPSPNPMAAHGMCLGEQLGVTDLRDLGWRIESHGSPIICSLSAA